MNVCTFWARRSSPDGILQRPAVCFQYVCISGLHVFFFPLGDAWLFDVFQSTPEIDTPDQLVHAFYTVFTAFRNVISSVASALQLAFLNFSRGFGKISVGQDTAPTEQRRCHSATTTHMCASQTSQQYRRWCTVQSSHSFMHTGGTPALLFHTITIAVVQEH